MRPWMHGALCGFLFMIFMALLQIANEIAELREQCGR